MNVINSLNLLSTIRQAMHSLPECLSKSIFSFSLNLLSTIRQAMHSLPEFKSESIFRKRDSCYSLRG